MATSTKERDVHLDNGSPSVIEGVDTPSPAPASKALLDIIPGKDTSPFLINQAKNTGPLKTFQMPASSVLSRVKGFLPQMAAADSKLKEELSAGMDLNIENVAEEDPHVEMNLGLAEMGDSSDSGCSSEEEVEDDNGVMDEVSERNIKLTPTTSQKGKPSIVLLEGESKSTNSTSCDDKTEEGVSER